MTVLLCKLCFMSFLWAIAAPDYNRRGMGGPIAPHGKTVADNQSHDQSPGNFYPNLTRPFPIESSLSPSTMYPRQIWDHLPAISNYTVDIRTLIIPSFGLIGVYLLYCLAYGLFFSPTRHIPGPLLTRFTKLYFLRLLFRGTLSADIHELHKKYGPVIRIGPRIIDVQLSEVTIQGWGGQSESKLPWNKVPELCKIFRAGMPVDNIVSIASAQESKRIRRVVGPPFAKKFLVDQEEVFKSCTKNVLEKIDNLRIKNENKVDMFQVFKEYALDVITEFAFGGYFKGGSSKPGRTELELLDQGLTANLFANTFPVIFAILRRIPWSKLRWTHSVTEFIQICDQSIQEYKNKVIPGSRKDSLGRLILSTDDAGLTLSHEELTATSIILLVAGIETTTTALTYTLYALAKYPEIRAQLADELSSYSDVDSLNLIALEKLPILNSVIRESLRLWPPAPGPLPRLSPPQGISIGEHYIPGGIQVSREAWAVCRDPEIFPDPETFYPKRWIGISREEEARMWDQSMIFSYGPRICLGKEMALMELRILISSMVLKYTWSGVPDKPGKWDEEMRPFDTMTLRPWNGKCVVELKPRDGS